MSYRIYYVGLDVHKAMTVMVVLNAQGKQVCRSVLETKAAIIINSIRGLIGEIHLTFEEGIHSAWLYDMLKPYVAELMVCNPREIKKTSGSNKSDDFDAFNLADSLRLNALKPVYHGEHGLKLLKELARAYLNLVADCTRVKNRITAIFRSRAISYSGSELYRPENRAYWCSQLEPDYQCRANILFTQLDALLPLREQTEKAMIKEAQKHPAFALIKSVPYLGDVRASIILAVMMTPFRFRTKRQIWNYSGFAIVTSSSADYEQVNGTIIKTRRHTFIRGLNQNFNRSLKMVFKSAALAANNGVFKHYFDSLLAKGMKANMARLTLARKIAAVTLTIWKKGELFNPDKFLQTTV